MKVQWLSETLDEYEAAILYLIAEAGVIAARQFKKQVRITPDALANFR